MSAPPVLHVGRPNLGDRDAFLRYAASIFDNRWLTNNGPLVQELERRIAALHEVRHCVAMCNGTVALEIAIRALQLDGEVIVPSYTFIATAHALSWQAITPVFADIDPATHNLDPRSVREAITPRTRGIIGVHLWGRPAPVEALQEIADEHGLELMFDAAHAFGCRHAGRPVGGFGRCEVLSFHATKVFNTFEGGAVLTNDDVLADKLRLMRNFGFAGYDNVVHPGSNGKMPEICAAMGLVNLEALPAFVDANRQAYERYRALFADLPAVRLIEYAPADAPNFQYAVIELDAPPAVRDAIVGRMQADGILARKYFWPGCHRMPAYSHEPMRMPLPATELVADRVIVLPTGASLAPGDAERVRDHVAAVLPG